MTVINYFTHRGKQRVGKQANTYSVVRYSKSGPARPCHLPFVVAGGVLRVACGVVLSARQREDDKLIVELPMLLK